jgi:hypothetical protein
LTPWATHRLLNSEEGSVVLPRQLAGSILRRVETTVLAVWVATSEPAVLLRSPDSARRS